MTALHEPHASGAPREAGIVVARSGAHVNTSTAKWMLSADETLDWSSMAILPKHLLAATREYVRQLIRTGSPEYVRSQFNFLKKLFKSVQDLLEPLGNSGDVDGSVSVR